MKKKLFLGILLLSILFGVYKVYDFMTGSTDKINPIYLIPEDAVFLIDTERPIDTWDEISHSAIWKHLQNNQYFSDVIENLSNVDKTFKEQKKMLEWFGERDLLISVHVYKPKSYDLLYTVDLQNLSKFKFLKGTIENMAGSNYEITRRTYKAHEITELYNKKTRETLYLSFIKNQLIASFTHVLVEKSIDQYNDPVIGRDVHFIEIQKETPEDGFFKLFLQYKYLNQYLNCFANKINSPLLTNIENAWLYSGFSMTLKESTLIQAEGFTNFDVSSESYLRALQKSGKGKRTIANIAPLNTSLYLSFAFDSFEEFHENFEEIKEENQENFTTYTEQVSEIEELLDIDVKKHIFSWIGDEIALLHINDDISKKQQDLAVVLKTTSIEKAKKNLDFLVAQIKEKTPLKFKQINYKGYNINFLDLKSFFKILAGNMFEKMEKPYFTIIEDYVIFSNSPNTLKEIINTQAIGYTLASSQDFLDFNDQFDEETSVFTYVNTPYAYDDLLRFADRKTRRKVQQNKDYILCFSQIGLQLVSQGTHFENYLSVGYENASDVKKRVITNKDKKIDLLKSVNSQQNLDTQVTAETIFNLPEIFPTDLSASKFVKKYPSGKIKYEVELKNGKKHGDYEEYYENGNLKRKGKFKNGVQVGTWKAYDEKEEELLFKKRF